MEPTKVGQPPVFPRRGGGLLAIRAVLVGLGALLGIALISQGLVFIGAILLTMAVLRTIMLVRIRRRRARWLSGASSVRAGRQTTSRF